ncbi:MAG: hypothetical protein OJF49_000795 [Ktedonobacterales bacterium]|nr:MAG: hypothetical protein OJF49_000795 [Ktedonobacterales bacterium]
MAIDGRERHTKLRRKRRKISPHLQSSPVMYPHTTAQIGRIGNCDSHWLPPGRRRYNTLAWMWYNPLRDMAW